MRNEDIVKAIFDKHTPRDEYGKIIGFKNIEIMLDTIKALDAKDDRHAEELAKAKSEISELEEALSNEGAKAEAFRQDYKDEQAKVKELIASRLKAEEHEQKLHNRIVELEGKLEEIAERTVDKWASATAKQALEGRV